MHTQDVTLFCSDRGIDVLANDGNGVLHITATRSSWVPVFGMWLRHEFGDSASSA
jgi:hypothetical protein